MELPPGRWDRLIEISMEYIPPIMMGMLGGAVNILRMKRLPRLRGLLSNLLSGGFCSLMLFFLAKAANWESPIVYFLCGMGGFAADITLTRLALICERRMAHLLMEEGGDDENS